MAKSTLSRIAHLLYASAQPLEFAQLVEELHRTLSQSNNGEWSIVWDGQSFAFFELAAVRIVVAVKDCPCEGGATCLTVAVELSTDGSKPRSETKCQDTCASVVEHLQRRYPAKSVIWASAHEPLTRSLHASLIAALPAQIPPIDQSQAELPRGAVSVGQYATEEAASRPAQQQDTSTEQTGTGFGPTQGSQGAGMPARDSLTRTGGGSARARAARARGRAHFTAPAPIKPPVSEAVAHRAASAHEFTLEFAKVRAAFSQLDAEPPPPPPRLSAPLRLTTHALNASLLLVLPPVGTAAVTYSVLKGHDMRFSCQMIVLTGLIGALMHTPLGKYMTSLMGA